ncbi:MAG: trehalose-6-phosphate synthase [Gemmatimonadota bacterium]
MKLVIISNRVPSPNADDQAGGLTVALRDALSESGGVWFGWNGEAEEQRGTTPDMVRRDNIEFATLPLSKQDLDGYYRGYANMVLWPLFHERLNIVEYREAFRASYASVNEYFAEGVTPLLDPDDLIWVQDYHLIPLGAELRKRGVSGSVGFFLHTPLPPYDVFRVLPNYTELLESFLAYDVVGMQTTIDVRHFADNMRHGLGANVDESTGTVELNGRRVRFGAFPIGIDVDKTAEIAHANRDTAEGRRLVEVHAGRKLVIGADRLDYTKGLVKRLEAFDRFLGAHEDEMANEMIYVQIAAPSRESVERYRAITRQLEAAAGRINGRKNRIGWTPLRLINRSIPRDALLGYFSLADVGLVTPLRDGMNLVAKEFLAAQTAEDPGVLVLSKLAGAADELSDAAVMVNPYDAEGVGEGLYRALTMPMEERRRLWEVGMDRLRRNTARIWRDRFLDALVEEDGKSARPEHPRPRARSRVLGRRGGSRSSSTTSAA